jgi:hypothetical protein
MAVSFSTEHALLPETQNRKHKRAVTIQAAQRRRRRIVSVTVIKEFSRRRSVVPRAQDQSHKTQLTLITRKPFKVHNVECHAHTRSPTCRTAGVHPAQPRSPSAPARTPNSTLDLASSARIHNEPLIVRSATTVDGKLICRADQAMQKA